jgi:hypothetical protein
MGASSLLACASYSSASATAPRDRAMRACSRTSSRRSSMVRTVATIRCRCWTPGDHLFAPGREFLPQFGRRRSDVDRYVVQRALRHAGMPRLRGILHEGPRVSRIRWPSTMRWRSGVATYTWPGRMDWPSFGTDTGSEVAPASTLSNWLSECAGMCSTTRNAPGSAWARGRTRRSSPPRRRRMRPLGSPGKVPWRTSRKVCPPGNLDLDRAEGGEAAGTSTASGIIRQPRPLLETASRAGLRTSRQSAAKASDEAARAHP